MLMSSPFTRETLHKLPAIADTSVGSATISGASIDEADGICEGDLGEQWQGHTPGTICRRNLRTHSLEEASAPYPTAI